MRLHLSADGKFKSFCVPSTFRFFLPSTTTSHSHARPRQINCFWGLCETLVSPLVYSYSITATKITSTPSLCLFTFLPPMPVFHLQIHLFSRHPIKHPRSKLTDSASISLVSTQDTLSCDFHKISRRPAMSLGHPLASRAIVVSHIQSLDILPLSIAQALTRGLFPACHISFDYCGPAGSAQNFYTRLDCSHTCFALLR